MATLQESDRFDIWAEYQREDFGPVNIEKADLRAAVNAVDDWVDANTASFNAAIPLPARAELSPKQKAAILVAVVQRRFKVI